MNNNDLIKNLKLGFMGTPSFAAPILERLIADNYYIDYVYTQSGRPAGRGMKVRNSIIYEVAKKNNIEIRVPKKLDDEEFSFLKEREVDIKARDSEGKVQTNRDNANLKREEQRSKEKIAREKNRADINKSKSKGKDN